MTHVHLIGIAGSGLSAIARVLLESGFTVSGSDRQASPSVEDLQRLGARVSIGHRAEQVVGADWVVRSSAVSDDNVEVQAALAQDIPVFKRADFLGRLMEGRLGTAVAGTHGKTSTTAMIAWMLTRLDRDPAYIIGSVSKDLGRNAGAGRGPDFVIEADEYDRMFLGLSPQIAVVTNMEHDHPDCYPTPEDYRQAFRVFTSRITPGGILLACANDPGAAWLLSQAPQTVQAFSYGLQEESGPAPDYSAHSLELNASGGYTFEADCQPQPVFGPGISPATIHIALKVPGKHNVFNALAALAVAHQLGLPLERASQALAEFSGTARRFDLAGEAAGVSVFNDYAHHPTEIRATLAAARARFGDRALWAVWQPHTYSRTKTLYQDFSGAFGDANHVIVTAVYAARESGPPEGFSIEALVASMAHPDARFIPELSGVVTFLDNRLQPGDIVLVLSAGDAPEMCTELLAKLAIRSRENV